MKAVSGIWSYGYKLEGQGTNPCLHINAQSLVRGLGRFLPEAGALPLSLCLMQASSVNLYAFQYIFNAHRGYYIAFLPTNSTDALAHWPLIHFLAFSSRSKTTRKARLSHSKLLFYNGGLYNFRILSCPSCLFPPCLPPLNIHQSRTIQSWVETHLFNQAIQRPLWTFCFKSVL